MAPHRVAGQNPRRAYEPDGRETGRLRLGDDAQIRLHSRLGA
ncbi:hypothetical protein [Streptomyces sp. MW-W600-10]|nr:hypothetical protein [Streptomyces sp. MW-W600-10]